MAVIDLRDAAYTPPHSQIGLLVFPVLGEDGAPDGAHEAVDGREVAEYEPRDEAKGSGEHEESEVGLGKGEVEGNLQWLADVAMQTNVSYLLAQAVAYIIKILRLKKV
jgi:hypothetical protein